MKNKVLILALLMLGTGCASSPRGAIVPTDRPFDLAIDGEGFFIVETGHGGYLFTRRGDFFVDSNRYLVTAAGYRLAPPVQIPEDSADTKVTLDGQIISISKDTQRPEPVSQLRIATFSDPSRLDRDGDYYLPTPSSGDPAPHRPGSGGAGTIKSRAIEK